jgi:biofilm PGA synthesis N-glycosyltransferase PgaC
MSAPRFLNVSSTACSKPLCYVLITPARNEEKYIEETIKSVVAQSLQPLKWVVVSDGSTDRTDEIVKSYAAKHDWIELIRTPERAERHFAGKVHAFNAGFSVIKELPFDIVGSLDADITFDGTYFEFLLGRFAEDPRLGVAGTPFSEEGVHYDFRYASIEHVSGACQLFRRKCFDDVGGYTPLTVGGIDLVAVTTARMRGWKTRTFTEKISVHHKMTQTGKHSTLRRSYKSGYHDYLMGTHPLWQISRWFRAVTRNPISGSAVLSGYLWAALVRAERPVSREFVAFRRMEQMRRLGGFLQKVLSADKTYP